ncbi:trehalose synthase like protein [Zymoseptoria brevis]|uniref:Trehalose synthase like protein n=1 Tax=Zymoseptoria brevis TaxID=1047168 RepID=A0A0F4GDL6_9PEZI|nr:trehalose synthase like protein [Zymoseptoria brevis]
MADKHITNGTAKPQSHPHLADVMHQVMHSRVKHNFKCHASNNNQTAQLEQKVRVDDSNGSGPGLTRIWIGLAVKHADHTIEIGCACNDGTYTMDFAVHELYARTDKHQPMASPTEKAQAIAGHLIEMISKYSQKNMYKVLGAGLSSELVALSPQLPSMLWADFDILPMALVKDGDFTDVDELADSMARRCVLWFGPNGLPRLQVGHSNNVEVDLNGQAQFTILEQYEKDMSPRTARAVATFAHPLTTGNKKIAFFSATPQGGGVALMRHALLRYAHLVGVDCTWYVPTPKPEVFRITKTNHNILQGLADADTRFTEDKQKFVDNFAKTNAKRLWVADGGPLAPRSKGGADIIIDLDPTRPVIYRSHIQIHTELLEDPASATSQVWNWLWSHVKKADLFIAHPFAACVPHHVPKNKLAYMPATTDWLDGLNKAMTDQAIRFHHDGFNDVCRGERSPTLAYPERDYIIQIARFDPAKGINDVLDAYAEFRHNSAFCHRKPASATPQLVLCGHASVDDPDGTMVFNGALDRLKRYPELRDSVIIVRLRPSDQLLNCLLSRARVALQLSTREGFEVKVSEALKKGVPVIARTAGGLPLQIKHNQSGYLVTATDRESEIRAVAGYLNTLFSNEAKYQEMSRFARTHVSEEVGTVGNAVCWMYLADQLTRGHAVVGNGQWVWDMARAKAGEPVTEGEIKLPRNLAT